MVENVFTTTFKALLSPKSGMVTKEGVDQRASNLFLVIISFARNDVESFFRQYYKELLEQNPTVLTGILNEKSLMGYKERHVRYSYNRTFTHFVQAVQHFEDLKSFSN